MPESVCTDAHRSCGGVDSVIFRDEVNVTMVLSRRGRKGGVDFYHQRKGRIYPYDGPLEKMRTGPVGCNLTMIIRGVHSKV